MRRLTVEKNAHGTHAIKTGKNMNLLNVFSGIGNTCARASLQSRIVQLAASAS